VASSNCTGDKRRRTGEKSGAILAAGFHFAAIFLLFLSIFSLVLTRFEAFNAWLSICISAAFAAAVCLGGNFTRSSFETGKNGWTAVALAALAFVMSWLHTGPNLNGGADEGNYLIQSFVIAQKGKLDLDLPILRDEEIQRLGKLVKGYYPGIYSAKFKKFSDDPSRMIPQFSHLTSATRAVAVVLFGLEGALWMTGLFSALAAAAFYLLACRVLGPVLACTAAVVLILNAAFIWNSRSTLTEIFTLFCIVYGLLLTAYAFEKPSLPVAAAAGLSLGLAAFSRTDGTLAVFLVFGFLIGNSKDLNQSRQVPWVWLTVYSLVSVSAFFDLFAFSRPYLEDLFRVSGIGLLMAVDYSALLLSWIALKVLRNETRFRSMLWRNTPHVLSSACLVLGCAFLYFYFYLPSTYDAGHVPFTARAATEMVWYLTLPVVGFYLAGLLITSRRLDPIRTPLLILSGIALVIFMWRPSANPIHPYISRRWIAYVIPFIILLSLVPVKELLQRQRKNLAILFLAAMIGFYGYHQWDLYSFWIFESQYQNYANEYLKLSKELRKLEKPFFLTDQPNLASILTYIYGVDVLLLSDQWEKHIPPDTTLMQVPGLSTVETRAIVMTRRKPPSSMIDIVIHPRIFTPSPADRSYEPGLEIDFSKTGNGRKYLVNGWSSAESWGTWSNGEEARLAFRLTSIPHDPLRLELNLRGFVTKARPRQRVVVEVNGVAVDTWEMEHPGGTEKRNIRIPKLPKDENQMIEIRFQLPDAVSPAELKISPDPRELAIGVFSGRITYSQGDDQNWQRITGGVP